MGQPKVPKVPPLMQVDLAKGSMSFGSMPKLAESGIVGKLRRSPGAIAVGGIVVGKCPWAVGIAIDMEAASAEDAAVGSNRKPRLKPDMKPFTSVEVY